MFTYPNKVKGSCNHNNTGTSFLPNHSPKITNRIFCWTLSYNIGLGLNKTLKNGMMNDELGEYTHIHRLKHILLKNIWIGNWVRGSKYTLNINMKLFHIHLSGCALCKNHIAEFLA